MDHCKLLRATVLGALRRYERRLRFGAFRRRYTRRLGAWVATNGLRLRRLYTRFLARARAGFLRVFVTLLFLLFGLPTIKTSSANGLRFPVRAGRGRVLVFLIRLRTALFGLTGLIKKYSFMWITSLNT